MSKHEHPTLDMRQHHYEDRGVRFPNGQVCYSQIPGTGYGPAFDGVWEQEDGGLWIGNGEYASPVNFCPVCGFKATKQVSYEQS